MLVFALDLEEVKEVGAGCVYLDEVFVGDRLGCWKSYDLKLGRRGDILLYLDRFHR